MEIGPYRVNEDGTLRYNRGRWDEFANILFVDNPVGTGFSYIDGDSYVHELDEMAAQMIAFLEKWFAIFPEYMYDDVSTCRHTGILETLLTLLQAIHRWRVLRWAAYPLHCARSP